MHALHWVWSPSGLARFRENDSAERTSWHPQQSLVVMATAGITFSLQARFNDRRDVDMTARIVLAAFSLVALMHPNELVAATACLPIALFIAYWVLRRRKVAVAALG